MLCGEARGEVTGGGASGASREHNRLRPADRVAHDWYRFVLSFPPHLVRHYLDQFQVGPGATILDPFCGTGTTLVECKKLGIPSVGIEANPMAHFASAVKLDWTPDPDGLLEHAGRIAGLASSRLKRAGLNDDHAAGAANHRNAASTLLTLPPETLKLLLRDSISPLPLHKTLLLVELLEKHAHPQFAGHERLALARAIISDISNLHFGPEVGVGPPKDDAPVISSWLRRIKSTADDLRALRAQAQTEAVVHNADSRSLSEVLAPKSIDAVITSPPYPNEKDYTRTTRLESVMLGFIRSKQDLRTLKQTLVRSNTRSVYKVDRDDALVASHKEIQRIANAIETRRIELGKTSGFERLYARVTRLYFGGMARHLADLRSVLRPGAQLAYVVGDQASYLRVMIRTGQLLADVARSLGYEVLSIDLFRTRLATATRAQLREEVVVLRWPGKAA